ncbi:MAG: SdrD B-like domain-containing protein [Pseudomonadota bacterium]
MSTIAENSGDGLIFTVTGNAADYGWGLTEDGAGIVIWNDDGFQILPANVQLVFSDQTIDTSSLFGDTAVHKLSGASSDWGWSVTEDGTGVVVWNDEGFQILPANVQLEFSDRTVDTSILFGDTSIHQLTGASSEWGWDVTEDGNGVVVWNDAGFEILPANVQLQFDDKTVDTSYLFAEPELASVGGTVWFDDNQNGVMDDGEGGHAGLTVQLYDVARNLVSETVSDADGTYQFDELAEGDYRIVFRFTGDYYFTEKHMADNAADQIDSDVNVVQSGTDTFTLGTGPHDDAMNAGIILVDFPEPDPNADLGSISGMVWVDENNNGLQDNGEAGTPHVRVQLKDANDRLLNEAISESDGTYRFDHLPQGDYTIIFRDIGLLEFSEKDVAGNTSDGIDSDANTVTGATDVLSLGVGENLEAVDAGLYREGFVNPYRQPFLSVADEFDQIA